MSSARPIRLRLLCLPLLVLPATLVAAPSFFRGGAAAPARVDAAPVRAATVAAGPRATPAALPDERFLNLLMRRENALLGVQAGGVRQLTGIAARLSRISSLLSRPSAGGRQLFGLALATDVQAYREIVRFNQDVRNSRAVLRAEVLALGRLARLEPGNPGLARDRQIILRQGRLGRSLGRPPISQPIPWFDSFPN